MSLPLVCTAIVSLAPALQNAASSQPELERARISGRVNTAEDAPWAGAKVRLVSYLYPRLGIGEPDVIETTSDGRGRFRAMVLPGRSYIGWASETVDGQTYRTTNLGSDLHAGDLVTLAEARRNERKRIRIAGLDAWKDSGPFECRAFAGWTTGLSFPIELDENLEALLPEMPGSSCTIRVIDRNGMWLTNDSVSLGQGKAWQAAEVADASAKPKAEDGPVVIEVAPPYELLVRIRTDAKKPIEGGWVRARQSGVNVTISKSDADGWAIARLPLESKSGHNHFTLMIGAPGRVQVFTQLYNVTLRKDPKSADAKQKGNPDLDIQLIRGTKIRGRLMLDATTPAARVPVLLQMAMPTGSHNDTFRGHSSSGDGYPAEVTQTDEQGRFEIEGYYPKFGHRLIALLDTRVISRLPRSDDFPTAPIVILSSGVANENPHDIGNVRIDELVPFDISVRESDGARARNAKLTFMEPREKSGSHDPYQQEIVQGSRRGTLRVLTRPATKLKIAAVSAKSYGIAEASAPKSRGAGPYNLVLRPTILVSGHIKNQHGQPLPDVRLHYYSSGSSQQDRVILDLMSGTTVRTRDDGSFSFPALPNTQYRVSIYGTVAGQRISQSNQMVQVGENAVSDLDFEVSTPKLEAKADKNAKEPDKR